MIDHNKIEGKLSNGVSVPELHLVRAHAGNLEVFRTRMNPKGRVFVSVFEDSPRLEWKISHSHNCQAAFNDVLKSQTVSQIHDLTILVVLPEGVPLFGKTLADIVDALVSKAPSLNQPVRISCTHANAATDPVKLDIVSSTQTDVSNVPTSVQVSSLVHYEKLMRRFTRQLNDQSAGYLVMEAISGTNTVSIRRTFVISNISVPLVTNLSQVANARSLLKRGNAVTFKTDSDRLFSRTLNNGSHLMLTVLEPSSSTGLEIYEQLFDALERMSLTALPAQPIGIGKLDFESVDQLPPLTTEQTVSEPREPTPSPALIVTPSSHSSGDFTDYELEITNLRAKNLALKHELDKYRLGGAAGGSAYSTHLVNEVKKLRADLEATETEKRKYATSRRLIDSLVEKSNKLSGEIEARNDRIDRLLGNEKILKTELSKMRDHCEYLVGQNRELELGYAPSEVREIVRSSDPPQRIDSLYKQFLFPFRGKNELEMKLKKLMEFLAKVGQKASAGHSVLLEIERANKLVDDIRGRVNDLIDASEKLEISAYCLIKNEQDK